jgi:hypothetical protein
MYRYHNLWHASQLYSFSPKPFISSPHLTNTLASRKRRQDQASTWQKN